MGPIGIRTREAQNDTPMFRKILGISLAFLLVLVAVGGLLFIGNAAPTVTPVSAATIGDSSRPYVVKLHARWCPVCMLTKAEWAQIDAMYADRVKLLVFDSTNDATIETSKIEAERLGLDGLWDRYRGASGVVLVLDGRTKEILAELAGNRSFEDYRSAIDAAIDAVL